MKKIILFDAEPFCFGPISTTLNLIDYLKKKTAISQNYDLLLLGTGTSRQLAVVSGLFDKIIECDTTSFDELEKQSPLIQKAALFVSTTNPHSINFLNRFRTKRIFIDTLFWMWGELRADFSQLTTYYIQRFFNIEKQLEKFGVHIPRYKVVSPLISFDLAAKKEENFTLINLGGIDTVYHTTSGFYQSLVSRLYENASIRDLPIVIAGGGKTIEMLRKSYERKHLTIRCLGKEEFKDLFSRCSKFISTPGLTSIHESCFIGKDLFLLPPQNYSQYLHLAYLKKRLIKIRGLGFDDLLNASPIEEGLPEDEGVHQVKGLVNALLQNEAAFHALIQAIIHFLKSPKAAFGLNAELAFSRSGVEEIGDDIYDLSREPV
jgi:hypothetical protein